MPPASVGDANRCMRTAEMMHCEDLLPLVRQWNSALHDLWVQANLPDKVTFWELDVVAMFPNLSKDRVWVAIQEMLTMVRRSLSMRGHLRFAINKIDRKLDRMGGGAPVICSRTSRSNSCSISYISTSTVTVCLSISKLSTNRSEALQ